MVLAPGPWPRQARRCAFPLTFLCTGASTVDGVEIEVLTVPACPHRVRTMHRLGDALARIGRSDVAITERQIGDAIGASRFGMHGSPTILIDGRDLFGDHPTEASLSCRLYQSDAGVDG